MLRILEEDMLKKFVDFQNNWDYKSHGQLFWKNLILNISIYSCVDIT